MLARVSILLLIVSASSNPMSCFETNGRRAALAMGNAQMGEPIASPPYGNIGLHSAPEDPPVKEGLAGAPHFKPSSDLPTQVPAVSFLCRAR